MNRPSFRGFTLIEMLTVMAVIAVLAGLILSVNGIAQRKAASARAEGEIATISAACESFKAETGEYPQSGDTDELDPRAHEEPIGKDKDVYRKACIDLYKDLSGDREPEGDVDGKPETGKNKAYYVFKPADLNAKKDPNGRIEKVNFIQDPWGNCYGYSTAGLKAEQDYRKQAQRRADAPRDNTRGYNPTFDFWSTAGSNTKNNKAKWMKNW